MIRFWATVAAVCTGILAVFGVLAAAWRMIVAGGRTWSKLDRLADELLGDRQRGIPSLVERVTRLEQAARRPWPAVNTRHTPAGPIASQPPAPSDPSTAI